MTALEVSLIDLPQWACGEKKIRFLYLSNNTSFKVSKQSNSEEHTVPLFLGADIFAETGIRTENHPRYHAKFAKKGLATKLAFSSDIRFNGLRLPCSSNSLWFYSIQGVFRVAFELYNRQDQLSVLESLQDMWRSRINDGPLNMSYNLSVQDDCDSIQDHQNPTVVKSGLVTAQILSDPLGDLLSVDHDYCSVAELKNSIESFHSKPLLQRLHSFGEKAKCMTNNGTEEHILKVLEYAECCVYGQLDEEGLMKAVMAMLQTYSEGFSIYSSPLLQAVAGWLGQQFHAANATISHQVEGFKVRHIERITDLPPAEELAAELFPEAMRTLLVQWMGLSEEEALWKRHSEYPILLLILEFANHNLITGVAHVLYSSLICK
ncbi:uncharacterized protein LOC115826552 [Chanos chanos]|uniref:Uncharacterized protein LOC115826552 n=1 Tax=Chanos chanos TaxID=29144 RepID=A0A6J2WNW8_CHACN|nr:uncharacterized protein LOC115826552 [Chanos chanos]